MSVAQCSALLTSVARQAGCDGVHAQCRASLALQASLTVQTGYAFSVWLDWSCSFIESDLSWRLPLAGQCVFGTLLALGGLIIPESPRWLLDTDQVRSARRTPLIA